MPITYTPPDNITAIEINFSGVSTNNYPDQWPFQCVIETKAGHKPKHTSHLPTQPQQKSIFLEFQQIIILLEGPFTEGLCLGQEGPNCWRLALVQGAEPSHLVHETVTACIHRCLTLNSCDDKAQTSTEHERCVQYEVVYLVGLSSGGTTKTIEPKVCSQCFPHTVSIGLCWICEKAGRTMPCPVLE